MKAAITTLIMVLAALLTGCGEIPNEESQNVDAILSPDGSRIAFLRSFRYYFNKATVFDPSGWEETVFGETSLYIIDRSNKELTKLSKISEGWYSGGYYSQVNISWEDDLIACGVQYTVHIMDVNGIGRGSLDFSREKYGPPIPFTLSGDVQRLFYLGRVPWELDREGLYSIRLDGSGKSFISDLGKMELSYIYDMMWDSSRGSILIIGRFFGSEDPVVWEIKPDGKGLEMSEQGLTEYRRRKLGGAPFSELKELTRGISYAEWDVPSPEEF